MNRADMLRSEVLICDKHALRIQQALKHLNFPIDAKDLEEFSEEQLAFCDLLTNRFAKLQNAIGTKVFPMLLKEIQEYVEDGTFVDQLHKLEKLRIIESVKFWNDLRDMRSSLALDYPDDQKYLAERINHCAQNSVILVNYWEELKQYISKRVVF